MSEASPEQEPIAAEIVEPGPIPPVTAPVPDYDERGVPSFDHVRSKIEGRAATSLGATELAAETPEARTIEDRLSERDRLAAEKLAEIRRSLGS